MGKALLKKSKSAGFTMAMARVLLQADSLKECGVYICASRRECVAGERPRKSSIVQEMR